MKYHITAFFLGFLLDLLFGDPYWLPHPIRLIGSLITKAEKCLLGDKEERNERKELRQGVGLVMIVLFCTVSVTAVILFSVYRLNIYAGIAVETIMTYQILAIKCLKV